jgi:hypothetical protein
MPIIIKRFHAGDVVGYCTIVRLLIDDRAYENRTYQVLTNCCQQPVERTHKQLRQAQFRLRSACEACSRLARSKLPSAPRQPVRVGDVMGPVVVLAEGPTTKIKKVIWSCCGKVDLVGNERLYRLRHNAKLQPDAVCKDCYQLKRYGAPTVDVPARTDWRPTEILPPGIISAAVAWPRPRLGA